LYRIQGVVDYAPDICLFEPLVEYTTRGSRVTLDEVAYLYQTMVAANILPVTLLLSAPVLRIPDKMSEYSVYRTFCEDQNLPFLDVVVRGKKDYGDEAWSQIGTSELSVWGKHCHYNRHSFVVLAYLTGISHDVLEFDFRVSKIDPDYASCTRKRAFWPPLHGWFIAPLGSLILILARPLKAPFAIMA